MENKLPAYKDKHKSRSSRSERRTLGGNNDNYNDNYNGNNNDNHKDNYNDNHNDNVASASPTVVWVGDGGWRVEGGWLGRTGGVKGKRR